MFSREQLNSYIERGLIREQVHPENKNVSIYNYTQKCQYEYTWDDVTTRTRGLIYNWSTGEQLSNPLPKFFNLEEHIAKNLPLPGTKPVIQEKLDGWLGILYWLNGKPRIATRGSFSSVGALWATKWLEKNIEVKELDPSLTYLFEIISPETKIVVNYPYSELVLLGARNIKDDSEIPLNNIELIGVRKPKIYTTLTLEEVKSVQNKNEEGFVIHFQEDNLRLKVKFEEYKRLHKILTGVSPKGIWEALKNNTPFEQYLENVPDEFYNWVTKTRQGFLDEYREVAKAANQEYLQAELRAKEKEPEPSRKTMANEIKNMTYPSIGFKMLDGLSYHDLIWKIIKPNGSLQTFKQDET